MPAEHKFDRDIEASLGRIVVNNEYGTARSRYDSDIHDFERYIDLFDAERSQKEYDWMSDIFIPEFPAHMLTQSSIDVDQYFKTRDFVDVYVEETGPEALLGADAARELINRTLNIRRLHFYPKFVRARLLSNIGGIVWAKCWWDRKHGHFQFEVLDPRNVFTDKTYEYTAQDKKWVIIRSERTLEELKSEKGENAYFNLDVVEEALKAPEGPTETAMDTREEGGGESQNFQNTLGEPFDKIERHGKFWLMSDGSPGINADGTVKEGAALKECIVTFVKSGMTYILIGFRKQPYKDVHGEPYRPIIRGVCYIHPTRDGGVGDGKYAGELQVALNDTFNLSNDRVRLATMPTFKAKRYSVEDNDTLYFEPGHPMEVEDPSDLDEFKIQDNIQGALAQMGILTNKMNQTTNIWPTTMGGIPGEASTTATAIAGGEQRTNQRTNYKSLTFEYMFLTELFWMIQQMTWQYAKPEQGIKLMGEKVFFFDPGRDYVYKPLSQSIETEYGKATKIRNWQFALDVVARIQHPDAPRIFNYIFRQIVDLMGDDYGGVYLDESVPMNMEGAGQSPATGAPTVPQTSPSNQAGIPMGAMQSNMREGANAGV